MTRDKLGGEVDDERQDHQNCRDGKGNVKLALFFGVDIERDGERCAGAGQTVKNAVQRVGKAGSEQQRADSPRMRPTLRMQPVMTPSMQPGSTTVRTTRHLPAPSPNAPSR